jgi:hypothetical protein
MNASQRFAMIVTKERKAQKAAGTHKPILARTPPPCVKEIIERSLL